MPKDGFFSCLCSWQSDIVLGHVDEAESEATQNTVAYNEISPFAHGDC